jgi:aminoglycoside 6'-N-acetyltransferase
MPLEPQIIFRALTRTDLPALRRWLNTPHVYQWWGSGCGEGALGGAGEDAATEEQVEAKYGPDIDQGSPTHRFIIETGGAPIGLIQWYRLADYADYARAIGEDPAGAAAIDLLIGELHAIGVGLGHRVLDQFVTTIVFASEGVQRAVAGPAVDNARSIRTFEKAGFQTMRYASVPGEKFPAAVLVRAKPESSASPRHQVMVQAQKLP